MAIVASSDSDLRAKLERAASTIERKPQKAFADRSGTYFMLGPALGNGAFLFPGQGSQYSEMGADLATEFEQAREAWDFAATMVSDGSVLLSDFVFPRPAFSDAERAAAEQKLMATEWAQPAIGAASLAGLRIFQTLGLRPNCVAGHSFGELTALFAAQISKPVRFVEMIEAMYDSGARIFVEIGPGSVLGSLVKQCLGTRPHAAVSMDRKGMESVIALWHALAQLSVSGVALDFAKLMAQFQVPPGPRKPTRSATTVKLIGSNCGKPYGVSEIDGTISLGCIGRNARSLSDACVGIRACSSSDRPDGANAHAARSSASCAGTDC